MRKWGVKVIVGAAVVVFAAAGYVMLHKSPAPPDAGQALGYTAPPPPKKPASRLSLPSTPRLLIIGDSWTYGVGASSRGNGYAYKLVGMLGWPAQIEGVPGSGYAKDAALQPGTNFADRIAALPKNPPGGTPNIVILQGSTNDNAVTPLKVINAEERAVSEVQRKYPGVRVLLIGPAFDPKGMNSGPPNSVTQLYLVASDTGAAFINPVGENWFTAASWPKLVDPLIGHPNDQGHAYLATKVLVDLRQIFHNPSL